MPPTKKLTKEDALAAIARNDEANAELRAFLEQIDSPVALNIPPIAVRFSTDGGETGVILRFPNEAQLAAYAKELNVTEKALLAMTGSEFLIRLFIARGGKVWDPEHRIAAWAKLRFPLDGTPLYELTAGMDSMSDLARLYKALDEQPTVADLIGHIETKFMSLRQNCEGEGATFWKHMAERRELPDPFHILGLLLSLADPSDASSYPSTIGWERVGAITPEGYVASLFSDGDGVDAVWSGPAVWGGRARVPASSSQ